MTQITLVLPFALPPAELAADLIRAMKAPALAGLLARSSLQELPIDETQRVLPHEAWLARTLSLASDGSPAFAAAAMRGFGLDPGRDSWFIVNPAHVEIARSTLSITDLRQLRLSNVHAKGLFETAKPVCDEAGKTLVYGDAYTWFMRAADWTGLETSSPDAAVGLNLNDWLPTGPGAAEFRKLQNEIQMLWFEHPSNVERESRGMASINSFWPWALSDASAAVAPAPLFAASVVPSWLSAMENCPATELPNPFSGDATDSILLRGDLSEAAIAGEWSVWLESMQRFEDALFAPALAALRNGGKAKFTMVMSNRHGLRQFSTSSWAQRAFWRSPSLDRLLP
ncbi:hypothetical protein [Massilia sp. CF038]|uniref:hypothetical protein n=1 Tax=Massilia sp. CF038 TaxID=1881045 RepID=UPI000922EEDB|nr:hypothetical protein [Massilia sp. CF038]SHG96648.1 hypothetical protein SAMN05428948_2097 [Massilia sp. CF038]